MRNRLSNAPEYHIRTMTLSVKFASNMLWNTFCLLLVIWPNGVIASLELVLHFSACSVRTAIAMHVVISTTRSNVKPRRIQTLASTDECILLSSLTANENSKGSTTHSPIQALTSFHHHFNRILLFCIHKNMFIPAHPYSHSCSSVTDGKVQRRRRHGKRPGFSRTSSRLIFTFSASRLCSSFKLRF